MKINEFTEKMAYAILAVNKLPSNLYRVIGINNTDGGTIEVHLGRIYSDERLEDWADLRGVKWAKKPHDEWYDRIEVVDDNGTVLFQLVDVGNEELFERGEDDG